MVKLRDRSTSTHTDATEGLFKKIKRGKKALDFFSVPIKIASIFHDTKIWLKLVLLCFFPYSGIPKLKIPPLDPFILQNLTLKRTSENIDVKGTLSKLKFTGVRNVKFSNLK